MAKTVAVSEADWPEILEDVKNHHEEVVITEDGHPIARLMPIEIPLRGPMYGTITFHGDITEPLDEEVVVTRDRQPIAKVVPVTATRRRPFRTLEELRESGWIIGDIMEPLDEEWNVEK